MTWAQRTAGAPHSLHLCSEELKVNPWEGPIRSVFRSRKDLTRHGAACPPSHALVGQEWLWTTPTWHLIQKYNSDLDIQTSVVQSHLEETKELTVSKRNKQECESTNLAITKIKVPTSTLNNQSLSKQISGVKSEDSEQEPEMYDPQESPKIQSEPTQECEPLNFHPIPDGVLDPSSGTLNTRTVLLRNKFGRSLDGRLNPQWQPLSIPATPVLSRRMNDPETPSYKDSPFKGRRSQSVPRRRPPSPPNTPHHVRKDFLNQHPVPQCSYSAPQNSVYNNHNLAESESSSLSSLDSLDLSTLPCRFPDNQQQTMGTLQREMNALFEQKMCEIRCHSPLFFSGKS